MILAWCGSALVAGSGKVRPHFGQFPPAMAGEMVRQQVHRTVVGAKNESAARGAPPNPDPD
ncbi:MAG: hypothetical protein WCT40_02805 [Candidatus Magasanikbacteria bacterium]